MIKVVKIGDKDVTLKSSAAIPHMYRRKFNRDIFLDMESLQKMLKKSSDNSLEVGVEALEMFESLAWCFTKHADPDVPDDLDIWLEQFELMDIYNIFPTLIDMWVGERASTSKLKKKADKLTVN